MRVRQATSVLLTTTLLAAPFQVRAAAPSCEQVFVETVNQAGRSPGVLASLFKSAFGRETPEEIHARATKDAELRLVRDQEVQRVLTGYRASYRQTAIEKESLYRQRDRLNARLNTVLRELELTGSSLFNSSNDRVDLLDEKRKLERDLSALNGRIALNDRAAGDHVRTAEEEIRQANKRARASTNIDPMAAVSKARSDEQNAIADDRKSVNATGTGSIRSGRLGQALRQMTPAEIAAERVQREKENQQFEARRADESRRRAEAEMKRRSEEKEKADGIRQLIERDVPGSESTKLALVDHIGRKWLESNVMSQAPVYIAIGNHETELSKPLKQIVTELVHHLTREDRWIVYDADSVVGPLIHSLSETAIGLSGRVQTASNPRVVSIVNPFLRMQTLLKSADVVMTSDSVVATGLLVEAHEDGKTKFHVLDLFKDDRWTPGLSDWAQSAFREKPTFSVFGAGKAFLDRSANSKRAANNGSYWGNWGNESTQSNDGRGLPGATDEVLIAHREEQTVADGKPENLGVSYSGGKAPQAGGFEQLLSSLKASIFAGKPRALEFNALIEARKSNDSDLINQYSQAMHYARVINQLRTNKTESEAIGGAVVFGSGKGSAEFEEIVSSTVSAVAKRGSAIRHGGAGGFMATAGRAALAENALSIGIPISGRHALDTEVGRGAEARGLTVETSGYEERIPALLENVPLVMIAPGGGGTMKEIAVTLISEASRTNEHRWIVFVGGSYYQGLETFLKGLPLPKELRARMRVVSSAAEMDRVLDEMKNQDPESYHRLAQGN